ncbi:MAG: tRNA (N6-isopentenyl adenosine(37)-C2)-methylthiotransferase MiaB, partial [Lachnospiraceae bacterium]|nr:tRNA (N6-isopentenyl adenosine(37)-C2)-methylthiotransferase MiaB [Lachnospiraceae bacterium]
MFDMLEYRVFADVPEAPQTEPQRQLFFAELCHREVEKLTTQLGHAPVAVTQTLGCQMNARDSEKINGIFKTAGFVLGTDEEKADYVIYNTCTVRENANLKVYGRLGYLHSLKNHKPHLKIALCGCMMQEPQVIEKIRESYSFVNLIFGTHNIYKFAELLYLSLTEKKQVIDIWEGTDQIVEDLPIDRKYAFKSGVNIMFGCDNFCSYCIVPYVRGRERSRLPEDIIHEIEGLVADGVVEVMLLGQNVNSYGKGLEEKIDFAGLLRRIEQIDGLRRIRFMTSHPKDLSDDVIAVMAASKKICRQLHLPFQAGSTNILKKMRRQYTKEQYLALVDRVKAAIPDISLSTDIMVGFPEESEEDFQ